MNRVVVNTMQSLFGKWNPRLKISLLWLVILLAACNDNLPESATPEVKIIGEVATDLPLILEPLPSLTPSPTALPSQTPYPTPRKVTVSRVSADLDPRLVTPIAEGTTIQDILMTDIDGREINLQTIDKPVVLNFWTVGCGSCFFEFPLLQSAYAHHAGAVEIIGINIADFPEETRLLAEQVGAVFPQVVDGKAELFTTYFNGAVVPTTIFITADGIVQQVVTGPLDAYNLDLFLQQIGLPSMLEG